MVRLDKETEGFTSPRRCGCTKRLRLPCPAKENPVRVSGRPFKPSTTGRKQCLNLEFNIRGSIRNQKRNICRPCLPTLLVFTDQHPAMDPITVSASILSIVQLVNDATRLFKRLQTLDEKKVSILYFKLMAEKTIMTTWANRMRLLNGDDLRKAVPPENFQDVMEIIEKLDQVFEEANKNLHSVIALGGEKLKPGNLKARFLWVSIGYEQLKESIELLETLNRALGIKAPGLPPYSPPGRGSDVVSAQATTEVTSSSALGSTTLAENPMNSEPSPGKEAPRTTLRTVYRLCLGTLRVIGAQVSPLSLAVRTVSSRLEMCATGFFEEPYPLDEILESHRKRCDPLREYILRTFIDIAIAEGKQLQSFGDDTC